VLALCTAVTFGGNLGRVLDLLEALLDDADPYITIGDGWCRPPMSECDWSEEADPDKLCRMRGVLVKATSPEDCRAACDAANACIAYGATTGTTGFCGMYGQFDAMPTDDWHASKGTKTQIGDLSSGKSGYSCY